MGELEGGENRGGGGKGRGPRRRDRKGESSTVVVAPASSSSSLFLRSPNCHGRRSGLREDEIDGRGATDRPTEKKEKEDLLACCGTKSDRYFFANDPQSGCLYFFTPLEMYGTEAA